MWISLYTFLCRLRIAHLITKPMCGILFVASRAKPERPRWFEDGKKLSNPIFDFSALLSRAQISSITDENVNAETQLTIYDQQKLDNVHELRNLQLQLNKWKNARNSDKIAEVELEIQALSLDSAEPQVLDEPSTMGSVLPKILARGPDYAQYSELHHKENHLGFFSSVLSLRQPFTPQPIASHNLVLQFNGELYGEDSLDINDTEYVFTSLLTALRSNLSREKAILAVLSSLDGEFAFVITDLQENTLYFGKDYIGKRSLLYKLEKDKFIAASILSDRTGVIHETEADSIHILNLQSYSIRKVAYTDLWAEAPTEHEVSFDYILLGEKQEEAGERVQQLHTHLARACLLRQNTIHPLLPEDETSRLGVLFSGGLDCTVIAGLLADNFVQQGKMAVIDLLTVGFENPRTSFSSKESPDRKLSVRSWFELCKRFLGSCVSFRLVQIDVPYSEWLGNRKRVLELIYPCTTEMDLSIAIAFYFACRAQHSDSITIKEDISLLSWNKFQEESENLIEHTQDYVSLAKVLFSGLGADELFGGYSRHENIFNDLGESARQVDISTCYNELSESLVHDIKVIYERNLGRDDRAMASWGKELRYPYLDNLVISFVFNEVEPELKVGYDWITLKTKKGEKRTKQFTRKVLLRHLAQSLGLPMAAEEIKRAIQFGAKSAKLEIGQGKVKGTDKL